MLSTVTDVDEDVAMRALMEFPRGWEQTDPDTDQYGRVLTDRTVMVIESEHLYVTKPDRLQDGSLDESALDELVSGYYDSYDQLTDRYASDDQPIIVGEILAEKTPPNATREDLDAVEWGDALVTEPVELNKSVLDFLAENNTSESPQHENESPGMGY